MVESPTLVSSDATDYAPGDLIGQKYRLVRFLGEGAQGSVWLAENLALRAEVAIKIVHGEPTNPAPTLRLEQEARAAAQIAHPAVVRVYDLGRTMNGDAFIVMEFLQGESLGERLTTCGRLSPVEAVRTLLPIADVLHVAHARGIVHRDLKPENVFLSKSGAITQPKLVDFGIAKLKRGEHSEAVITEVGALVGSPAYVSPEQALCREDIGQAADVWSFCVVLYECITGKLPFDSENCRELFRQIGEEAPRPILSYGAGDFELWEIIRRGLAKAPAERWPDMQALARALAGWLKARGVEDDISGIRLDSRWLAKGRTEPIPIHETFDPPSFIRRVGSRKLALERKPAESARRRRPAARWLVLGGLGAAALPALIGYWLLTPRSPERAEATNTKVEVPVTIQSPSDPGAATELAATTSSKATPGELPPSPPTPAPPAPPASQVATSAPTPIAGPEPDVSRTVPRRPPRGERRAPNTDLIEPY